MRIIIQRCKNAKCIINQKVKSEIEEGLVLFVGFTEGDTKETILGMVNKILNLRIFDDDDGVMNRSVLDVKGEILSISQFTLYADCKKGNRPSYLKAMKGPKASLLYDFFNKTLSDYLSVQTGVFGANMDICFTNHGPVTIMLER